MSKNLKRFTVGFEPAVMAEIGYLVENTHFKAMPDVLRAAVTVFVDLLSAEDQGLQIVLRDRSGAEWAYSPFKPGRAAAFPVQPERELLVLRLASNHSQASIGKSSSVSRFTIGFEESAFNTIAAVIEYTHFNAIPDVLRASITVFSDLLRCEERQLQIVLRDGASEWLYSPHKPGRATALRATVNVAPVVLRPAFGKPKAHLAVVEGGGDNTGTDGGAKWNAGN